MARPGAKPPKATAMRFTCGWHGNETFDIDVQDRYESNINGKKAIINKYDYLIRI